MDTPEVTETVKPAVKEKVGKGRAPGCKKGQFGHGRPVPVMVVEPAVPVPDPGPVYEGGVLVPPLLVDFRAVGRGLVTATTPGRTPNQKAILKMHSESFDKFMTRFERMESDFREAVDAAARPAEELLAKDEAEEKVQRTIRELLDKAKGL